MTPRLAKQRACVWTKNSCDSCSLSGRLLTFGVFENLLFVAKQRLEGVQASNPKDTFWDALRPIYPCRIAAVSCATTRNKSAMLLGRSLLLCALVAQAAAFLTACPRATQPRWTLAPQFSNK
eukprot:scaffold48_cov311-Pinguiococcus_pyrenoidosus.AAC.13